MKAEKRRRSGPVPAATGGTELYVYLVKGRVPKHREADLGETFMGNWVEGTDSFLFFSSPEPDHINRLLLEHPHLQLLEEHHFTDEQWQGGDWALQNVADFVIVPPGAGQLGRGSPEGVPIILDPGVVFGNGLHPTTQGCLHALCHARKRKPFHSVLDLGTGTGILALAAAYLGADRVLAVDLNPLCAQTAERNVRLNHMEDVVAVREADFAHCLNESAELVLANMHYEAVAQVVQVREFSPGEQVIASGLMRTQVRHIRDRLKKRGFTIVRQWDHEMKWHSLHALLDV